MNKKSVLSGLSTIALFVVVYVGASMWQTRNLPQGEANSFSINDLNGIAHSFEFSEKQKPVLLHFFATWCPICELENDTLNSLSKDYEMIVIAMQSGESSEIKQYKQEHSLSMTIYNDHTGEISKLYNVKGVPTSFIIAPSGQISSSKIGYATELGLRFRLWISQI